MVTETRPAFLTPIEATSPPDKKFGKIQPFITLFEEITSASPDPLKPEESQAAIALSVMIYDPKYLEPLAEAWDTHHNHLTAAIEHAYDQPKLKKIGYEIFDRKKEMEKEKQRKTHNQSVDELQQKLFETIPPDLLTTHERIVVEHVRNGLTNKEIGTALGIKNQSVAVLLVHIRKKIDPFIQDLGLVRVTSYRDNSLTSAASEGRIDAVKILRIYHSTPNHLEKYLKNKREIDQNLIDQGYVLLTNRDQISEKQHHTLLGKTHTGEIIRKNNRAYVQKDYLEKFKNKSLKRKRRRPIPEGYTPINNCIPLPDGDPEKGHVYRMTLYHIKKGNFSAVRDRRNWFVKEEEVAGYIQQLIKSRRKNQMSTHT